MTTANPYAAPNATDFADNTAGYSPEVFSFSGRIGRLRYLAYGMAWNLCIGLVGSLLIGVLAAVAGNVAGMVVVGSALIYIAFLVPTFAMTVRRLNDLNVSGWLSLLMLVPLVNFVLMLFLVFAPGTQGLNKYGPAPGPNSGLVVVAALVLPLIFIVGILAAVALPAYNDYLLRVEGIQMQQLN